MWPPPQQIPITAPKKKPATRRRGPSLKATKALARAAEDLSPYKIAQLNLFVAGKCMGLSNREAALHAGVVTTSPRQLAKKAWEMATHPYVRTTFAEARESIAREQLCTFAEQVLDIKAMAMDCTQGVQGRVQAHQLLAKLMGHEAPAKVQAEVRAGVMLVPMMGGMDQWEKTAMEHQLALQQSKG